MAGNSPAAAAAWILAALGVTACSPDTAQSENPSDNQPSAACAPETSMSDLKSTVLAEGEGAPIGNGQSAVVHYTGWLYDTTAPDNKGKQFDSSRERGQPFSFKVGAGRVIKGWDLGVCGMKVGDRRLLVIPPELGYGSRAAGGVIPANSTLLFDVELLAIDPR